MDLKNFPLIVSVLGVFAVGSAALADRAPTQEERIAIEAALKKEGFTRWEEIELDDGYWEVDDATGPDGRQYDLKLDPKTLKIIQKDRD